jgi:hypothetical protein
MDVSVEHTPSNVISSSRSNPFPNHSPDLDLPLPTTSPSLPPSTSVYATSQHPQQPRKRAFSELNQNTIQPSPLPSQQKPQTPKIYIYNQLETMTASLEDDQENRPPMEIDMMTGHDANDKITMANEKSNKRLRDDEEQQSVIDLPANAPTTNLATFASTTSSSHPQLQQPENLNATHQVTAHPSRTSEADHSGKQTTSEISSPSNKKRKVSSTEKEAKRIEKDEKERQRQEEKAKKEEEKKKRHAEREEEKRKKEVKREEERKQQEEKKKAKEEERQVKEEEKRKKEDEKMKKERVSFWLPLPIIIICFFCFFFFPSEFLIC